MILEVSTWIRVIFFKGVSGFYGEDSHVAASACMYCVIIEVLCYVSGYMLHTKKEHGLSEGCLHCYL